MADPNNKNNNNNYYRIPYQQNTHDNTPVFNVYSPEFLFQEEANKPGRGWGDTVQFYTGSMYLAGAVLGATKGTFQGISTAEPGESMKLRVNRILNSGGGAGRKLGNSLGVMGLIYAFLESGISDLRKSDDVLTNVLAGLGTGTLYKAASGPKHAALAGAIGGLAAGAAMAGKQVVLPMIKRYVPNIPI